MHATTPLSLRAILGLGRVLDQRSASSPKINRGTTRRFATCPPLQVVVREVAVFMPAERSSADALGVLEKYSRFEYPRNTFMSIK